MILQYCRWLPHRNCASLDSVRCSNSESRTVLQAASEVGHVDIVRLLISEGADINIDASNMDGHSALQAAVHNGTERQIACKSNLAP